MKTAIAVRWEGKTQRDRVSAKRMSGEVGLISALGTSRMTRTDWMRFSWITYRHADLSL